MKGQLEGSDKRAGIASAGTTVSTAVYVDPKCSTQRFRCTSSPPTFSPDAPVIRGGRRARALCARRARHQFALLVEAIAKGYLTKAAAMREWSDATQRATLVVFGNAVYRSPAARSSKLWRLVKGEHELRCIAVYMATGIDLRLIEGEDFRRTELLK